MELVGILRARALVANCVPVECARMAHPELCQDGTVSRGDGEILLLSSSFSLPHNPSLLVLRPSSTSHRRRVRNEERGQKTDERRPKSDDDRPPTPGLTTNDKKTEDRRQTRKDPRLQPRLSSSLFVSPRLLLQTTTENERRSVRQSSSLLVAPLLLHVRREKSEEED
jgi:hypothetical protein